jgi:DNA-binding SARP family transcriptional activator
MSASTTSARTDPGAAVAVRLIEGFELAVDGEAVETPAAAQRLIAFLALHPRPLTRAYIAGSLWLDKTDDRATSNLRSALWRTHGFGERLIRASRTHIQLAPGVYVDVAEIDAVARQMLAGRLEPATDAQLFRGELLPDWYDEWVVIERERLRQLCLNALEQLSLSWLGKGSPALAIDAAFAAVAAEPLRESAHRVLVEAHLAAGNCVEAVRQYRTYAALLKDALDLEPTTAFTRRVAHLMTR